jgi:hypothetical protein
VLMQDRCTVCTEHTIGIEIVLDALDRLLGDEAQVEARFCLFGDSATLGARLVHGLCRTYHRLIYSFGCTQWNSIVTWVVWNPILARLDIVLVSVQDKCTVCTEHAIGIEIILDAPDRTRK